MYGKCVSTYKFIYMDGVTTQGYRSDSRLVGTIAGLTGSQGSEVESLAGGMEPKAAHVRLGLDETVSLRAPGLGQAEVQ